MKKDRRRLHDLLLYLVFIIYIVILLFIIFRMKRSERIVKLIPFSTISSFLAPSRIFHHFTIVNILGNIVLFMPFGVYFTLFSKNKKSNKNVLWIALISFLLETTQYIFKLGVADIDDVILNALGGYLGILSYRFLLNKWHDENKVRLFIEIMAPIGAIVSFIGLFFFYGRF